MKTKCIMVSLDISTKSTGITIFQNAKPKKFVHLFKNSNKTMALQIWFFLEETKPDIVVIEKPIVIRNARTQSVLERLAGVVEFWCILKGNIDFVEYRPTEWRKLIKNTNEKLPRKRIELKEWAIERAKQYLKSMNKELDCDDVAESYLLGLAHIRKFENQKVIDIVD